MYLLLRLLFLSLIVASGYLSVRYVDIVISLAAFLVVIISLNNAGHPVRVAYGISFWIAALLMIQSILPGLAITSLIEQLSLYQLFRSILPLFGFILIVALLHSTKLSARVFDSRLFGVFIDSVSVYFVLMSALYIIGSAIHVSLMPGIYLENSTRVFPPGVSLLIPMALLSWIKRRHVCLFSCLILLVGFQSKSLLVAAVISLLLLLLISNNFISMVKALRFNSASLGGIFVLLVMLTSSLLVFGNRFSDFLSEGDLNRSVSSQLALSGLNSAEKVLIGIGHGTQHSVGFYDSLQAGVNSISPRSETIAPMIENSKYDIEMLPIFLLVRHGIIGSILFVIFTFRAFNTRLGLALFFTYVALVGLGGSILNTFSSPALALAYLYIDRLVPPREILENQG